MSTTQFGWLEERNPRFQEGVVELGGVTRVGMERRWLFGYRRRFSG